jgi:acetylornithine deacetylase
LLFTTDEEGAGGCCVQKFLESGAAERFEQVIVAEPTECKAVLAHRGFLSVKMRFSGLPGHSSEARALADNANHQMALWAAAAVEAEKRHRRSSDDPGNCLNIGLVGGGTKSNVIAGESRVHWSARLGPGKSTPDFLREMKECVPAGSQIEWEVPFAGEPLPASGHSSRLAEDFCRHRKLARGAAVDFWTEAALFSAAGMPALVLGPGSIAQAHVTDEWLALDQLERCVETYGRLVRADG